jgi:hypothetical protein
VVAERARGYGRPPAIPDTPLIAATAFGPRLAATRVAAALEEGLRAGGVAPGDQCPLQTAPEAGNRASPRPRGAELASLLAALDFDVRMRAARAVVLAERWLEERTLQDTTAFEIATRARQAGVPCYAVTSRNRLDAFDARMLDLQLVLQARDASALRAAGRRLAAALRLPQP